MSSTITSDTISHQYGYAWLGTAGKSASTATRDGIEVRRNLSPNPGFEVDITGWVSTGLDTSGYGAVLSRSTVTAHSGAASGAFRITKDTGRGIKTYWASHTVPVASDTDYLVSLWVAVPKALPQPFNVTASVTGTYYDGATVQIQAATNGWQRIVIPVRSLVNRTDVQVSVWNTASWDLNFQDFTIYVDDVLVETGSTELPYFDGSTPAYSEYETTRPLVVNGWEEAATGGNRVNPVVGGGFDVTLQAASLRQGAFELVYQEEADAAEAFAMHCRPSTFTITDTDRASAAMSYVIPQGGRISRALDDQTREYWIVRVEYQEV